MVVSLVLFSIGFIIVILLRKSKLDFFAFLLEVGLLFFLMLYLFDDIFEQVIISQIIWVFEKVHYMISSIETIEPLFYVATESQMLSIFAKDSIVTFFFDYECTGIIEILVYVAMVMSYPLFTTGLKLYQIMVGYLYLMLVNIARVFIIMGIILLFGRESIFVAHVIIARIFYFIMTVILYYSVFTKQHIASQKVGGIR